MFEGWWTGTARDKNGIRRKFAVYGGGEFACRRYVERYGYDIVEIRRDSSYSSSDGSIFRVQEEEEKVDA